MSKTLTGTSDPDQTRKFFELFGTTAYDYDDKLEGPMWASYREHCEAGQQLANFMIKFVDFGEMTWYEFERTDEMSAFLNEKELYIERKLMTLSGALFNVYTSDGTLVGYCHLSDDTFVMGVKVRAKRGDYVAFQLEGESVDEGTRQGLYLGDNKVLFEVPKQIGGNSVDVVGVAEIWHVVPDVNLLPDTLAWVLAWRKANL